MSFFRSKEPDVSQVSREKRVKENIVVQFSAVLKSIQATQHNRPGEPIYTSDSANQLCCIFEAVFLHGHKSTQRVRNVNGDRSLYQACNYWSYVQKFSHKDTIYQLKRLANINTEVGMCRAWVKLAINDGLMESYITAMLAQPKVIQRYYDETAMLRDLEQPGILLKLMQVLANYEFQLVYNLTQLNTWTVKTLAMAGFIDMPLLAQSTTDVPDFTPSNSSQRSRTSTLDMEDFPNAGDQASVCELSEGDGDSASLSSDLSLPKPRASSLSKTHVIHDKLLTLEDEKSSATSAESSAITTPGGQFSGSNAMVDEAARELERLRTLSYDVSDILNVNEVPVIQTPTKDAEQNPSSSGAEILASSESSLVQKGRSSSKNSIKSLSQPHPDGEKSDSQLCMSPDFTSEEPESLYCDANKPYCMPMAEPVHNEEDAEEQGMMNGKEKVNFRIGTPLSDCMAGFSGEHSNIYDMKPRDEDELKVPRELDIQEDSDDDVYGGSYVAKSYGSGSPEVPLSAARAILNKRVSAESSNTVSSLIHGNSLSSLTGWGSAPRNSVHSVASMEKVRSYAEIFSESEQLTSESLAVQSPPSIASHTTLSHDEESSTPEQQLSNDIQTVGSREHADDDEFVVVGQTDEVKNGDDLSIYGEICVEKGLNAQDFKCHTCSAPIGIIYGNPLVCSYVKKYFCSNCHMNDEAYIPSKIVHNWDFMRYKVCRTSKEFLTSAELMPLLDIQKVNPEIYNHIDDLQKCKELRIQLFYLKKYLFACSPAMADELKKRFWPKEYLYEEMHTYSVQDLVSLRNSSYSLISLMKKAMKFASSHVQDCESCQYRGFICEICNSAQAIFPFDLDTTTRCDKCSGVYHKVCFTSDCPKCERITRRNQLLGKTPEEEAESAGSRATTYCYSDDSS